MSDDDMDETFRLLRKGRFEEAELVIGRRNVFSLSEELEDKINDELLSVGWTLGEYIGELDKRRCGIKFKD